MADEIEYNNEGENDEEERLKEFFTLSSDEIQRDKTWSSYPPFEIERVELLRLLNENIDDINKSKESVAPWVGVSVSLLSLIISSITMSPNPGTFYTNPFYLFLIAIFLFTAVWTSIILYKNYKVKLITSNELYDKIEEISNG